MIEPPPPEELRLLQEALSGHLRAHYGDATSRRIAESEGGFSPEAWRAFARDLGLMGAGLDESLGGSGGGPAANAVILQAFGRALVMEPFLSTAIIGARFLTESESPSARALLPALIEGDARIAFAHGEAEARDCATHVVLRAQAESDRVRLSGCKAVVPDAASATHLIVTARIDGGARDPSGLCAFVIPADAAGLERRDYRTVSGRPASDLAFHGVSAPRTAALSELGGAGNLIERVLDEAAAMVCAEAVGVLSRLVDDTAAYLMQRTQFGVAIGGFQALQHRMSDMLIHLTLARALTAKAVAALGLAPRERARSVSAAKAYIGKACRFIGQNAVQLHGGIGVTDELTIGRLFRRAYEIERQFGTRAYHVRRFDALRPDAQSEGAAYG